MYSRNKPNKAKNIMKSTTKSIFAIVAAAVLMPAVSTMANSGLIKVTQASDTPYRQKAQLPVASAAGSKFQIAAVKTATNASAPNSAASVSQPVTHPRWR
jgi:lipopolysaccharide/colanic/teichoic acid biosynthesis glycosyltransferase